MADSAPNPPPDDRLDDEISSTVAAQLLQVTDRHLRSLATAGFIARPYTLRGCVQGFLRHLEDQRKRALQKAGQSKVMHIRAESLAFQLSIQKGEYLKSDLVLATCLDIFGPMRAALDGLPAQFSRDLPERARLDAMIGRILNVAAGRIEKMREAVAQSGSRLTPEGEAVARRLGTAKPDLRGRRGRPRTAGAKSHSLRHPAVP